ncbi:MAG TPA: MFS transporter, partial [Frankiaceae bacterium]|nr:MFS transporter [Frankiaceae bacterium]
GRKRLLTVGFAIFTVASFACGVAGTAAVLNVSRGAQGVGAAILFAVGPALLGHEFHGKERAVAFGVFGAATGLAVALGPLIGGALTSGVGWRWIFFVNIPLGVVAIVVTVLRVGESRDPEARYVNVAGMVTFTLALAALVLAIIRGNDEGWTSALLLSCYAVAAVLLTLFVIFERRLGDRAMFDLTLFRNVTFVGAALVTLVANGAGLPSIFIETNYVENLLHSSAWSGGLRFLPLPLTLTLFLFGAVSGALIGHVSFRVLMTVSCTALGVGLMLTRLAGADSVWNALIPSLVVTGVGMGMFNPTRAALAIGITEPARASMAPGINETFQQTGIAMASRGSGRCSRAG